jgi:hypothetical protein
MIDYVATSSIKGWGTVLLYNHRKHEAILKHWNSSDDYVWTGAKTNRRVVICWLGLLLINYNVNNVLWVDWLWEWQ